MLVDAIIGFFLGYAFVAFLIALWLGLGVLREFVTSIFELGKTIFDLVRDTKPITLPIAKIADTPTQKLELAIGLIAVGYTVLLAGVALVSKLPLDVLFVAWLMLSAMTSYLGNKRLTYLKNQPT